LKKGRQVIVNASVFGCVGEPSISTVAKHTGGHVAMPGDEWLTQVHEAKHGPRKRNLWRYAYKKPWRGLVTGWSFRQTGNSVPSDGSWDDYSPGYLASDQYHKVWMVQPMKNERWLRPIACLEADLVGIGLILRVEDGSVDVEDSPAFSDHLMSYFDGGDDMWMLACETIREQITTSAGTNRVFLAYYDAWAEYEDGGWNLDHGYTNPEAYPNGKLLLVEELK